LKDQKFFDTKKTTKIIFKRPIPKIEPKEIEIKKKELQLKTQRPLNHPREE